MSTELRLKMGAGDQSIIWVDWREEPRSTKIEVNVDERNNLRIMVNGHNVAMVKQDGTVAFNCHSSDPEKDKLIERLKAQNGKFAKENADMQVENHRLNAEIERLKNINKKGGERESKWIIENGELRQSRDTLAGRILEIHKIVHGDH